MHTTLASRVLLGSTNPMKDRLSVYNVKLVPIRTPLVAMPVSSVLVGTTSQRKAELGASHVNQVHISQRKAGLGACHVNQVHIKMILEEPPAFPALWADINLIEDSHTVLHVQMAIPQTQIVRNVLLKVRKNYNITIYPEILAIIKFGDLRKTRLYFNIGEN